MGVTQTILAIGLLRYATRSSRQGYETHRTDYSSTTSSHPSTSAALTGPLEVVINPNMVYHEYEQITPEIFIAYLKFFEKGIRSIYPESRITGSIEYFLRDRKSPHEFMMKADAKMKFEPASIEEIFGETYHEFKDEWMLDDFKVEYTIKGQKTKVTVEYNIEEGNHDELHIIVEGTSRFSKKMRKMLSDTAFQLPGLPSPTEGQIYADDMSDNIHRPF